MLGRVEIGGDTGEHPGLDKGEDPEWREGSETVARCESSRDSGSECKDGRYPCSEEGRRMSGRGQFSRNERSVWDRGWGVDHGDQERETGDGYEEPRTIG